MTVKAKVQITFNVDCSASWNDSTTVEQVVSQARQSAVEEVQRMAREAGSRVNLTGDPSVTVIQFDSE